MPPFEDFLEQFRDGGIRPSSRGTFDFMAHNMIDHMFSQSPTTQKNFGFCVAFIKDRSFLDLLAKIQSFDSSDTYKLSTIAIKNDLNTVGQLRSILQSALKEFSNAPETSKGIASTAEKMRSDCISLRKKNFENKDLDVYRAGSVDISRLEQKFNIYSDNLEHKYYIMFCFVRDIEPMIINIAQDFFVNTLQLGIHQVSAFSIRDLIIELEDVAPYDDVLAKSNPENYDITPVYNYLQTVKDLLEIRNQRNDIDGTDFGDKFAEVLNLLFKVKDPAEISTLLISLLIQTMSGFSGHAVAGKIRTFL